MIKIYLLFYAVIYKYSIKGIVSNVMYDSTMNDTFIDFQSNDNSTKWFGQNKEAIPIWILNQ
jgi:hypothetical protein